MQIPLLTKRAPSLRLLPAVLSFLSKLLAVRFSSNLLTRTGQTARLLQDSGG